MLLSGDWAKSMVNNCLYFLIQEMDKCFSRSAKRHIMMLLTG